MANIAALRTYLRYPIGLGLDATGTKRAHAIINEGINSIGNIEDLYNDRGIKTVCQNVRKPVGTIANPNWVAPIPNPGVLVAPMISTPGHQVPAICEQRLNLSAYRAIVYSSINHGIDITRPT